MLGASKAIGNWAHGHGCIYRSERKKRGVPTSPSSMTNAKGCSDPYPWWKRRYKHEGWG
ncbi:MAG: hypothetical protein Metus_1292 [Candidatus Methanosuratincola subterraneus]|uniref:Uncharacterized protein n=1 Tax=Methanosuratincola subterraneus TaxID=2593994 RepID=A0A3S3TRU2_METS7|nr:MAG: hypothetical protein Metus_1292 [Candidatus Methanosuratincola subterraneus]